jgi:hypothetical protein
MKILESDKRAAVCSQTGMGMTPEIEAAQIKMRLPQQQEKEIDR